MTAVIGHHAQPLRPEMIEAVLTRGPDQAVWRIARPQSRRSANVRGWYHLRLWLELDAALKSRDRATTLRDRLEDIVVQAVFYPRVRLPHDRGARHGLPPRPPGLHRPSRRRCRCPPLEGSNRSAALLGTPADTVAAIRLKLAVVLATGAPGTGDCDVSP